MAATCGLVCHKTSAQLMEQLQAHTQTLSRTRRLHVSTSRRCCPCAPEDKGPLNHHELIDRTCHLGVHEGICPDVPLALLPAQTDEQKLSDFKATILTVQQRLGSHAHAVHQRIDALHARVGALDRMQVQAKSFTALLQRQGLALMALAVAVAALAKVLVA